MAKFSADGVLTGYLSLTLSALFFSIMSLAAKVLLTDYSVPVYQILFFRSAIQVIGSASGITLQHLRANQWKSFKPTENSISKTQFYVNLYLGPPQIRFMCAMRGLSGFGALSLFYFSMEFLSLADANTLLFTSPIWTAIMAKFFLNESFGKLHMISAFITILGAICISRPSFLFPSDSKNSGSASQHLLGSFLAMMGSLFTAISYTLIRSLGKSANPFILSGYFGAICASLSFPILIAMNDFDATNNYRVWLFMLLAGLCAVIGQTLLNIGLSREKAGAAAMLRNLDVVFAFIFEIALLGQRPPSLSFFGAFLVCAAVVVVGLAKVNKKSVVSPPLQTEAPSAVIESAGMLSDDADTRKGTSSRRRKSLLTGVSDHADVAEFELITAAEVMEAQQAELPPIRTKSKSDME